jgi:hypothetical protein
MMMPDQSSPRRRFQFRLRTLLIVVAVVAVILGTRALMVRPILDTGAGGWPIVYDDTHWWMAPLLIDGAVIGLAVWFVRRHRRCTR